MTNKLLLVNCLLDVLVSFGYFRNFHFVAKIIRLGWVFGVGMPMGSLGIFRGWWGCQGIPGDGVGLSWEEGFF